MRAVSGPRAARWEPLLYVIQNVHFRHDFRNISTFFRTEITPLKFTLAKNKYVLKMSECTPKNRGLVNKRKEYTPALSEFTDFSLFRSKFTPYRMAFTLLRVNSLC